MKKLHRFRKKKQQSPEVTGRITNETVAEHREKILAGGRRFKYPLQYAKHKLVINTIIISVAALVLVILLVWWQLYPVQNTSTFFYRITRVLPLPVASIDGQDVRYSNYLMGFRSQEHYLTTKENVDLYSKDNKQQLDWIKRQALDDAIEDSYAQKIANEKGITVAEKMVDDAIQHQRQSRDGVTSQETYDAIVLDHFNWTPEEAREVTKRKLLRQEVAYKVDTTAARLRDQMTTLLATEKDFDKVAATVAPIASVRIEASITPLVPANNQDGGLAEAASKLQVNEVSSVFRSTTGDGYYVVKLLQRDGENRVSYASLKVPLTEFERQVDELKKSDKIIEYIDVPEVKSPITQ